MNKLRFFNGRFMKKSFNETLRDQWLDMINSGTIPIFKFETGDDSYLVVDLKFTDQGIEFSFDIWDFFEPKIYFSGEVVQPYPMHNDTWLLPFDPFFENLHHYLEQAHQEITEGFLIPNNLLWE